MSVASSAHVIKIAFWGLHTKVVFCQGVINAALVLSWLGKCSLGRLWAESPPTRIFPRNLTVLHQRNNDREFSCNGKILTFYEEGSEESLSSMRCRMSTPVKSLFPVLFSISYFFQSPLPNGNSDFDAKPNAC